MYMDYLFYLKTLQEEERIKQILLVVLVLGILLLIGLILEIFKKKYSKKYEHIKKLLTFNIFNKIKTTKKDV